MRTRREAVIAGSKFVSQEVVISDKKKRGERKQRGSLEVRSGDSKIEFKDRSNELSNI